MNNEIISANIVSREEIVVCGTNIIEDILKEYRINPKFNTGLIPLNKQEQEDEAFKILEIKDIDKILFINKSITFFIYFFITLFF